MDVQISLHQNLSFFHSLVFRLEIVAKNILNFGRLVVPFIFILDPLNLLLHLLERSLSPSSQNYGVVGWGPFCILTIFIIPIKLEIDLFSFGRFPE